MAVGQGNSDRPVFEPGRDPECEAELRAVFDNVSSGIAVYEARNGGEDFVFVDFNRAAEVIERIRREYLIGKSVLDVFPGVKEFGLFEVMQRVWRTGTPEHHPVATYKDKRIGGWRENYVFKLPSGRILAVYDDMTRTKRDELVRSMSEQCFRAVADYTYDWEVWVSPAGRALWTNPAAQRVSGYTIREILAMKDYPMPLVYNEDRDRIGRAFRSALKGSTGNNVEFRIQRKDGGVVWAEMSWQPICDEKGMSLGHRESIRDITARKKAESELVKAERDKQTILDSLAEHVLYLNRDLEILWANRVACESSKMSREELIGRRCYDIWPDGEGICRNCPALAAIRTRRAQGGQRRTVDGRIWLLQGSPVLDEAGEVTGAVEIGLDITDRTQMEAALRASEEKYRSLVGRMRADSKLSESGGRSQRGGSCGGGSAD